MLDEVKNMIEKQRAWVDAVLAQPDDWDRWQVKSAKKFNELFPKLTNKDLRGK